MSSSKQLATLEQHLNTGAANPNAPDPQQRVLDEDTYVDTLEHIITRDFYPDLYTLNKQNQHIEQYGTPGQHPTPTPIKQYKQHNKQRPITTTITKDKPNTFENAITPTPHLSSKPSNDSIEEIASTEDTDLIHYVNGELLSNNEQQTMKLMDLKQFHHRYTSEDNHSFSEIMYKNQLQHYAKYPWIYEQQKNADDRKKYLSILSGEDKPNNANETNLKSITLPTTDATSVMVTETDEHKTKTERVNEENDRKYEEEEALKKKVALYKGELSFWPFKAVNKLMFHPEADRAMNLKIVQKIQSQHGKPVCVYNNTRLPKGFVLEDAQNHKAKPTQMEKDLKGYSMVHTPQIKPVMERIMIMCNMLGHPSSHGVNWEEHLLRWMMMIIQLVRCLVYQKYLKKIRWCMR
eukprot:1162638_1